MQLATFLSAFRRPAILRAFENFLLVCALAGVSAAGAEVSGKRLELRPGDRIVFLGDTLMEREGTYGHLEYRLTVEFPDTPLTFRNLGWSADLPTGKSRASFDWIRGEANWFTNLIAQIKAAEPTVVFLGYGMAASFEGVPGLAKFRGDVVRLMDAIQRNAGGKEIRFVIASPIRHEELGAPLPNPASHNAKLNAYREQLEEIATSRNAGFLDFFKNLPITQIKSPLLSLTDNGIHLNDRGYQQLAETMAHLLNFSPLGWDAEIGQDGRLKDPQSSITISEIRRSDHGLSFLGQPARLILPRVSGDGSKVSETKSHLRARGLAQGTYVLKIDGVETQMDTSDHWDQGVELIQTPFLAEAEELHRTILKKNELYFHRWRPENSTYLFLFRKQEQGQNAREVPQFDPLISEQEQKLALLQKPKAHRFELSLVPANHALASGPKPESKRPEKHDPSTQPLPSFDLGPDIEIQLFAENPLLYKPIHMNFDAQGRLFVASSSVYPQIKPGQAADDSIVMLEDTDGDGKADKSAVFADGLLIPTGVEPGDGGVYVGQSTELLHFRDTNGDGRADLRRTVLSGFGTEDTHHILHTLHWGMDGQLYMNQSIYIHTHTETPHGVVDLNSGGILNLRPNTLELGIHMKGLVNTWGHQFDLYGQSFATDGAGIEGINYVVPQAMYTTYAGARRTLSSVSPGTYPKFCGLEILYSPQFVDDWQGSLITCDFRAHRVVRFAIREQGSAYVTQEMPDLVRSKDASFRPIDVKLGPDGALYIADWSNPIIQHGEVDFRDPRRDKERGRIWRVTNRGRPSIPRQNLTLASTENLLNELEGASGFHREKARRVLAERGTQILPALQSWVDTRSQERALLEGLWLHQSLDHVDTALLKRLLAAQDGRIRSAAVRVLSFWRHRVAGEALSVNSRELRFATPTEVPPTAQEQALALLAPLVSDDHPRVRLEALRALAKFPNARSAELALSTLNKPLDPHLEYALWLTINDLADPWLNALKSGEWKIEGREKQLEYGLRAIEPARAGTVLNQILEQHPLDREGSGNWIELIGQAGGPKELRMLLERALSGGFSDSATVRALASLDQAVRLRKEMPQGDYQRLSELLRNSPEPIQVAAIRLAGGWKRFGEEVREISTRLPGAGTSIALRDAVLETLREIGGETAIQALRSLSALEIPLDLRRRAIVSLNAVKPEAAAVSAVKTLLQFSSEEEAASLWRSLLATKGTAAALTKALPQSSIPPAVAKGGLRAARESGRSEPELVLALTRGADLAEGEATLSDAELKTMAADVTKLGNAGRGESVYRRSQLACLTCHAIGGAGGKVGPDMTSIGASAPVDYLIESVWFPNRKVKEGYHSLRVETKDGQDLNGILVREDTDRLVLRDTLGGEITIAKNNIEKQAVGGSLMPAGLIDGLNSAERLDLFRFLSELGKPGPFDASKGTVARGWKLRPGTHEDEQYGLERIINQPLTSGSWKTAWSLVDGKLLREELQQASNVQKYIGLIGLYAATRLQVPQAGPVRIHVEGLADASLWIGGKAVTGGQEIVADLPAGTHSVVVRLDPKRLPEFVRLTTQDGTFVMP